MGKDKQKYFITWVYEGTSWVYNNSFHELFLGSVSTNKNANKGPLS